VTAEAAVGEGLVDGFGEPPFAAGAWGEGEPDDRPRAVDGGAEGAGEPCRAPAALAAGEPDARPSAVVLVVPACPE
jgi:hypothetical protein